MSYYCIADGCDGITTVMQTVGIHRRRKCRSCGKLFYTEEIECHPIENPCTLAQRDRKADGRNCST